MKRIYLYLLVFVSVFATSCNFLGGDEDSDYDKISGGLSLYFVCQATNNYAVDGMNVAMRLALLLTEMESVDLEFETSGEPDWTQLGDVTYKGLDYNKKTFLFGNSDDVSITRNDGDSFVIEYGSADTLHTSGIGEICYRVGAFNIETSGNTNILDSDSDNRWSVTLQSDSMTYAIYKNSRNAYYECDNVDVELWYEGDGVFGYSSVNSSVLYEDYGDSGDWSTTGTITISDFTNLTMDQTIATDFSMTIDASGTAIYPNTYTYYTVSPVIYNFLSGANAKYGGTEIANRVSGSSIKSAVLVETSSNGLQTITYNGTTLEYDDEYYFYYYYTYYNTPEDDDDDE